MEARIKALQAAFPDVDYMMAETLFKAYDRTGVVALDPTPEGTQEPTIKDIKVENKPESIAKCEETSQK